MDKMEIKKHATSFMIGKGALILVGFPSGPNFAVLGQLRKTANELVSPLYWFETFYKIRLFSIKKKIILGPHFWS